VIDPVLPRAWKQAGMIRKFRGAEYRITIQNPDGVKDAKPIITVDGEKIEGNLIPIEKYGQKHYIAVKLGKSK